MGQIFISHNHNDDPFVSKLAQDLTKYGLKTFVDHLDIKFGKDWTNKVQQALDDCDQMIAVISDQSRDSRNCTDEWAYFIHEKKEVIPVWLTGKMYFRFAKVNYIDFRTDYAHPLQQLISGLTDDINSSAVLYEESKLNLPTHRREKENTTLKARLSLRYPLLRLPTRSIGIATGNIAEIMGVDVIVNSENPELSMADINGGSVSSALNFYSAKWDDNGNLIEETIRQDLIAARRHLPERVPLATVLATAATGSLKLIGVRYVIHAATVIGDRQTGYKPATPIQLGRAITNSLSLVDSLNCQYYRTSNPLRTVVFPVFGTGEGGLEIADVVQGLIERAIDYLETHLTEIEHIYFCAYAQSHFDQLKSCLDALPDLASPSD